MGFWRPGKTKPNGLDVEDVEDIEDVEDVGDIGAICNDFWSQLKHF